MKYPTFLTLCICMFYISSKSLGDLILTERDLRHVKGKYCGPVLSDTLSALCKGKYYSPRPHKKSGKFIPRQSLQYQKICYVALYEDNEEFTDYPFLRKRTAYNFLADEVSKRGVVEECCNNACSMKELQSYCR